MNNSCDNPISLFAQSNKRKHKSKRLSAQIQKTYADNIKIRHQQIKEPRPLGRGSYSKNKISYFLMILPLRLQLAVIAGCHSVAVLEVRAVVARVIES